MTDIEDLNRRRKFFSKLRTDKVQVSSYIVAAIAKERRIQYPPLMNGILNAIEKEPQMQDLILKELITWMDAGFYELKEVRDDERLELPVHSH